MASGLPRQEAWAFMAKTSAISAAEIEWMVFTKCFLPENSVCKSVDNLKFSEVVVAVAILNAHPGIHPRAKFVAIIFASVGQKFSDRYGEVTPVPDRQCGQMEAGWRGSSRTMPVFLVRQPAIDDYPGAGRWCRANVFNADEQDGFVALELFRVHHEFCYRQIRQFGGGCRG